MNIHYLNGSRNKKILFWLEHGGKVVVREVMGLRDHTENELKKKISNATTLILVVFNYYDCNAGTISSGSLGNCNLSRYAKHISDFEICGLLDPLKVCCLYRFQ